MEARGSTFSVRCHYVVMFSIFLVLHFSSFHFSGVYMLQRNTRGTPPEHHRGAVAVAAARGAAARHGFQTHPCTGGQVRAHSIARADTKHGTRFPSLSVTFSPPPSFLLLSRSPRFTFLFVLVALRDLFTLYSLLFALLPIISLFLLDLFLCSCGILRRATHSPTNPVLPSTTPQHFACAVRRACGHCASASRAGSSAEKHPPTF